MPNTKAIHLKSLKKFLLERSGPGAWERVLENLTPADRHEAAQLRLPHEWFDYALWWRLITAADRVLGRGDLALVREIGSFDARENLHGIYRVFLSFLSPEHIITRTQLIWRQYYDVGQMKVAGIQTQRAMLRLTDFPALSQGHEQEILGWIEGALLLTGVHHVQAVHPGPCLARGDDHCVFEVTWK